MADRRNYRIAPSEYDLLVRDLIQVQELNQARSRQVAVQPFPLHETGNDRRTAGTPTVRKALASPEPKPQPRPSPRAQFNAFSEHLMTKAMSAFDGGHLSGIEVAQLLARIHHLDRRVHA